MIESLRAGCKEKLIGHGVAEADIVELKVGRDKALLMSISFSIWQCSGAYELPYTAECLIRSHKVDVVVPIGRQSTIPKKQ